MVTGQSPIKNNGNHTILSQRTLLIKIGGKHTGFQNMASLSLIIQNHDANRTNTSFECLTPNVPGGDTLIMQGNGGHLFMRENVIPGEKAPNRISILWLPLTPYPGLRATAGAFVVRSVGKGPPCRMEAEPLREEQGHTLLR